MPSFNPDDLDIYVEDFVDSCSKREIRELIDYLRDEGHLDGVVATSNICATEYEYIKAISKLRDKWNRLSQEEEQTILKIANRF